MCGQEKRSLKVGNAGGVFGEDGLMFFLQFKTTACKGVYPFWHGVVIPVLNKRRREVNIIAGGIGP